MSAETGALGVVTEIDVPMPMRDGTTLRANVFRPDAAGRFPALLLRTPYGKPASGYERYVRAGYVVVAQDTRGRYASDGEYVMFTVENTGDAEDGYDSIEWLAQQPYCNGKVGTFGASYCAWMQWQQAKLRTPLEENLEVVGYPEVVLHAASSAPDTDFFARLVDDDPEGRAPEVCYGMVRARHRNSLDREELLTPGAVTEYRIRLGATACCFRTGHRLRLETTSSDFPNHDRNHNTGKNDLADTELRVAQQQVFHTVARPSRLIVAAG